MRYKRVIIFWLFIGFACYGAWNLAGKWSLLGLWGYVVWYAIVHWSELKNIRGQDMINPLKWGSVVFASFMKMMFPLHIVEQLILRMYDMECRKCVAAGSCMHCGCSIEKVYTPWDKCSDGNWGPMVEDAEVYRKMREEFPVEVSIWYPREEEIKNKA